MYQLYDKTHGLLVFIEGFNSNAEQMCAEADQLGARIEAMIANGKLRI